MKVKLRESKLSRVNTNNDDDDDDDDDDDNPLILFLHCNIFFF